MSAPKLKWKDATNYSRGDTERIPQTWEADLGGDRVVVTRHIHHAPTDWVVHAGRAATPIAIGGNVSAGAAQLWAEMFLRNQAKAVLRLLGDKP
jgi:hypothetical protein